MKHLKFHTQMQKGLIVVPAEVAKEFQKETPLQSFPYEDEEEEKAWIRFATTVY